MLTIHHFLIISAALFSIGIFGLLTRRNAVVVLMSIELILNAASLNFIVLGKFVTPGLVTGKIFAIFIIAIAAAEAAVAMAIIVGIFKYRRTVDVEKITDLKW